MDGLHTSDCPPPFRPTLTLVRLKAGEQMTFRILSERVFGLYTHWNGKKSSPCLKDPAECQGCKRGYSTRWKGFLHVLNVQTQRQLIFECTAFATSLFLDQVEDRRHLRGLRVLCERSRGADNGRLKMTLLPGTTSFIDLPVEVCPLATLEKLWGEKPPPVENNGQAM